LADTSSILNLPSGLKGEEGLSVDHYRPQSKFPEASQSVHSQSLRSHHVRAPMRLVHPSWDEDSSRRACRARPDVGWRSLGGTARTYTRGYRCPGWEETPVATMYQHNGPGGWV